ncbi:MAG: adenosylcobinamide-phosphate synthase CbiB [Proteobacteria bacterium]|nr:adenosylcobinamide-phosphate synthase CbiB [Pseudomonadota bacterium]MBU1450224.1 adenosylcobinamide-phosphate synthase CbiB [Pseudomonadota bacterium]MBU2470162.1 adenosylcobinamide-phosphate synthase CbiB [Pseudomonadota bacterium]MBU2517958.1 adenosylcobinamide-phosphate synthase CbiB [Pseudomonadota bacterium]
MIGAWIIAIAAVADASLGDPPSWPHMVRYMGRSIAWLEGQLRSVASSPFGLRMAGLLLVLLVVGGFSLAAGLALWLAGAVAAPLAWLLSLLLSWQCLSAGQLWREAHSVLAALDGHELELARKRLSMIVGRDTKYLDLRGVRRAVVETVAENFNDGVVAPLLYLALLGPVGAVAYKAVNTLDSMVGYRDERYRDLGWAAARLDDLVGWVPARFSALLLVAACPLLGLDAGEAWRAALRDHGAHKSPNSAWPEAAAAGALGVRLGGPNYYHGQLVDKPWINPAGGPTGEAQAAQCVRLMQVATVLAVGGAFSAAWGLGWWS